MFLIVLSMDRNQQNIMLEIFGRNALVSCMKVAELLEFSPAETDVPLSITEVSKCPCLMANASEYKAYDSQ